MMGTIKRRLLLWIVELLGLAENRPYMRKERIEQVKFILTVVKINLDNFSDEPYMVSLIKKYQQCIMRLNRIEMEIKWSYQI